MIDWMANGLVRHNLDRPKGLIECDVIIDVGCGVRPINWYKPQHHVCVEPHLPYLQRIAAVGGYECVHADALTALGRVRPGTAGAIYILDVIEHLPREDGLQLVQLALMAQPQQIVIFTPDGFLKQDGADPWGLGGDQWQLHRSGWVAEDFPGWAISYFGRGFFAIWTNAESSVLAA